MRVFDMNEENGTENKKKSLSLSEIEEQARIITAALTAEPESKKKLKEEMQFLRAQMELFLENEPFDDELARLQKQAKVLDRVISTMLLHATELEPEDAVKQYGLALKAQSQYRQTAQVVNKLQRQLEQDYNNNPDSRDYNRR